MGYRIKWVLPGLLNGEDVGVVVSGCETVATSAAGVSSGLTGVIFSASAGGPGLGGLLSSITSSFTVVSDGAGFACSVEDGFCSVPNDAKLVSPAFAKAAKPPAALLVLELGVKADFAGVLAPKLDCPKTEAGCPKALDV